METARKDSWKTQPMPQETNVLKYSAEFSSEEFERISHGLIPQEMEDRWFIYLEGSTLCVHRSWTGFCVYQVEFARQAGKHRVHRALVNRNQDQYRETDDAQDAELLHSLISNVLLGREE